MDVMGSGPSTSITSPPEWSRMSFIKWGWFSWFATNVTICYMLATHKNAKHVNYMFNYSILLYYIYIICSYQHCSISSISSRQLGYFLDDSWVSTHQLWVPAPHVDLCCTNKRRATGLRHILSLRSEDWKNWGWVAFDKSVGLMHVDGLWMFMDVHCNPMPWESL